MLYGNDGRPKSNLTPRTLAYFFSFFCWNLFLFCYNLIPHNAPPPPVARLCLLEFKIEPFINLLWNSIFAEQQMTKVKNLRIRGLVKTKIQQTKMLFTCQRFGDLFLFGLVWQYSSVQTKYNKGRFKVMATYLQQ